jgi:hypothetical protein
MVAQSTVNLANLPPQPAHFRSLRIQPGSIKNKGRLEYPGHDRKDNSPALLATPLQLPVQPNILIDYLRIIGELARQLPHNLLHLVDLHPLLVLLQVPPSSFLLTPQLQLQQLIVESLFQFAVLPLVLLPLLLLFLFLRIALHQLTILY